jgi:CBS domain-containing protein
MTSSDERVDNFMQRNLVTVQEETTLVVAAKTMADQKIGCLLVHGKGVTAQSSDMIGLLSETDLVRKGLTQGLSLSDTKVAQIMATPVQTIPVGSTMLDASHVMEQSGVRHLCVADGKDIVGLISVRDLVKHFVYAASGPLRDLDDVYRPLSILMQRSMATIDRDETLSTVATFMADKRIGSLLVSQSGAVVGIVTERDLVQKVIGLDQDLNRVTVGAIMSFPVIDIDINRTVHDASDLMAEKSIRHLTVTENHAIVGILSVRDLIRMVSVRDRPRFLREKREHGQA